MSVEEKRARVFAAVVLTGIGLFASVVGAHDAFGALEVGSRFGGVLLLVVGSALVAAGVTQVVGGFAWAPTAGVFASALGVMVGTSLIAAQLLSPDRSWPPVIVAAAAGATMLAAGVFLGLTPKWLGPISAAILLGAFAFFSRGDYDERLVIWAAFIFASVLAACSLWRVSAPSVSVSAPKLFAGAVGFFSVSALIGGAQFWYTSQYLPSSQSVSLAVETDLRQLGTAGGMDVVELMLRIKNTSQTQADILGSVFRVSGSTVRPLVRPDRQMGRWLGRPEVRNATISRYRRGPGWDLVQVGRVFPDGWWLEPNETFARNVLVHVPRGRYDTLRSQMQLLVAKRSALDINELDRSRYAGVIADGHVKAVVTSWPIRETSWFRDLTRGNREVSLVWVMASDRQPRLARFPHLVEGVGRVGEEVSTAEFLDYNLQTAKLYGLGTTASTRELALDLHR